MLKSIVATILLFTFTSFLWSQNVTHGQWTDLLQKYVDPYGNVNYQGFKSDEEVLNQYLEFLEKNPPQPNWKVEQQEAFWINAYNAFTIKLILKYYPLKTIMDIKEDGKDAWNIPFIDIGGKLYTLNYIEKTMLLGQFNDSRIHFAINCSAKSCPPLRNKAYTAENLNIELRLAARGFINDDRYNILSKNHLQVSKIFEWYASDFLKEESSIPVYINKQTPHLEIAKNASLNFLKYNWDLNGK